MAVPSEAVPHEKVDAPVAIQRAVCKIGPDGPDRCAHAKADAVAGGDPRVRPAIPRAAGIDESRHAPALPDPVRVRSEEHTSELQSHVNLVCRLLLEKKKKKNIGTNHEHIDHKKAVRTSNTSQYH